MYSFMLCFCSIVKLLNRLYTGEMSTGQDSNPVSLTEAASTELWSLGRSQSSASKDHIMVAYVLIFTVWDRPTQLCMGFITCLPPTNTALNADTVGDESAVPI